VCPVEFNYIGRGQAHQCCEAANKIPDANILGGIQGRFETQTKTPDFRPGFCISEFSVDQKR
jgi:hypothetical protein